MKALIVVAHPDDETIWAGGLILRFSGWEWTVLSLCRATDPDRASRFQAAMNSLGATGFISDLDDSPVLAPLSPSLDEIKSRILGLPAPQKMGTVPSEAGGLSPFSREYDLILTHGPRGEYTRHERHEQVHAAVRELVARRELAGRLVFFAYEDGGGAYPPRPARNADALLRLTPDEFDLKRRVASGIYGFHEGSFEYSACGDVEAFMEFDGLIV